MKPLAFMTAAAAMLLIAQPVSLTAQGAASDDAGWWDWALPDIIDLERVAAGRDVGLPLPRETRDRQQRQAGQQRQGHGPPFCRNGSGHPVHGMQWCREKGWTTGGFRLPTWEPASWEEVILRGPRDGRRGGTADRGSLIDILGDVIFGHVDQQRHLLGADAPLSGRWITGAAGALILQIRAGDVPIAEFTDLRGGGRADAVLLNSGG